VSRPSSLPPVPATFSPAEKAFLEAMRQKLLELERAEAERREKERKA
jgi:hypothetical protein